MDTNLYNTALLYAKNISNTSIVFSESLPVYARHFHYPQFTTDAQLKNLIDTNETFWCDSKEDIVRGTTKEIHYYLNFYGINAEYEADEFKTFYFTGLVASDLLHKQGQTDISKLYEDATVAILDKRLSCVGGGKRPLITSAMRRIVEARQRKEILGKHGMYLIYKCVFNALRDRP